MNTFEFREIKLQIREEKLLRIKWDEKRKRSMEKSLL
jgi:L-ribulose-5-phosphate 3-epimerase UlaE